MTTASVLARVEPQEQAGPLGLRLRAEDRALVICARRRLSQDDSDRLAGLLSGPVEWQRLLQGAQWHKLQGLLYRHLAAGRVSTLVPPGVLQALQEMFRGAAVRQIVFEHELSTILAALRDADIEVVLLKGAALVDEVYGGDTGVRPMADLDLLVRAEDAVRARQALESLDFRPGVDGRRQEALLREGRQLAAMWRPGSPVIVELHTHLAAVGSPIRFDVDFLWRNRRPAGVAGIEASALMPTPLLAAQAVNFLKDRRYYSYAALGQLCDVAEVVRLYGDEIDWQVFYPAGELVDLSGVLFGALYPAKHLLDAPVPGEVLDKLTPAGFRPAVAAAMVRDRVFGREWIAKDLSGGKKNYRAWQVPWLMVRRVFLSRSQFEYRAKPGADLSTRAYIAHNVKRLWGSLRWAARSLAGPRKLYEDVSVDRWLKSLYGPGGRTGASRGG